MTPLTRGQRYAGDFTAKRIARGDDPVASLDAFLDGFRRELLRNRVVLLARLDRHGDDGTTCAKVGAARTPAAFARRRTLLHSPGGVVRQRDVGAAPSASKEQPGAYLLY